MSYQLIRDEENNYAVEFMCKVFEVSRSGYYDWLNREASERVKKNGELTEKITESFYQSRKTYGYRRVHQSLKKQGEICGKHRVHRLMKNQCLQVKTKRKFKVTTDSNHQLPVHPNILNRQFTPEKINSSWVSDITYVSTQEGWLYLAVIMDLYSRQIIGWAMDANMTENLVLQALKMALFRRKNIKGLLLHSDRGSQYASKAYQQLLLQQGIQCSMSRKGNCWDNAAMESFFRSLKVECVYQQTFKTREEAKRCIFDYIEIFYNRLRKHSTLNYCSPVDYEKLTVNL